VRRATEAERERLNETFAALCRIESPSGHERACADWITGELRGMGLEVEEDDAGPRVGSDAGNLFARIAGPPTPAGSDSILMCAHMDTVPLTAPVEPVRVDGGWTNANDGILGADNKSAVAVILEVARRLTSGAGAPPVGVEVLFTVCEEISLLGAFAFDVGGLHSRFGYVFDHATPIGEIVTAAPTLHRIVAELLGRAAHAGVRPEAGRSAIAAAGDRGDAARPDRPRDDHQRRDDPRRDRDQRSPRALPDRGRGAERRPRSGRGAHDRDGRPLPECRRRRRMRSRRHSRADDRGLPDPTSRHRGDRRRGGTAVLRL
jgi:tripeptide aminopeptidase